MTEQMTYQHRDHSTKERQPPVTEDIHIRNYDGDHIHRVTIKMSTGDECVFKATYRLIPDEAKSIVDTVSVGEYDVAVEVDNQQQETSHCRVGDTPAETVFIELGNGIISITNTNSRIRSET